MGVKYVVPCFFWLTGGFWAISDGNSRAGTEKKKQKKKKKKKQKTNGGEEWQEEE